MTVEELIEQLKKVKDQKAYVWVKDEDNIHWLNKFIFEEDPDQLIIESTYDYFSDPDI